MRIQQKKTDDLPKMVNKYCTDLHQKHTGHFNIAISKHPKLSKHPTDNKYTKFHIFHFNTTLSPIRSCSSIFSISELFRDVDEKMMCKGQKKGRRYVPKYSQNHTKKKNRIAIPYDCCWSFVCPEN